MATNDDKPYTLRLMRDICEFYKEDSKDMFIVAEEMDITVVHALIIGPEKTPYQNGFFYFVLRYPSDYPLKPPAVKLMTTGAQRVRFNPNLYACGKVCLSILGTWTGPAWSAAQTLFTTLLSIQTLMNEKPYHNEPGYEEFPKNRLSAPQRPGLHRDVDKAVNDYNQMITHETIRVAVIQMLEDNTVDAKNMPKVLKNIMISKFKSKYQFFEDLIRTNLAQDGQPIIDPFGDHQRPKVFQYKDLLERLLRLKNTYFNVNRDTEPNNLSSDDSEASTLSETELTIKPENGSPLQETNCQSVDPLLEEYNKITAKVLAQSFSKPKESTQQPGDNWDDLIDSMNEDINEDTVDSYSSDEETQEMD